MPAHNYTPVPLEDEHFARSYNTGIPSTAPPSFQTVPPSFSNSTLPHRNDESAATIMPRGEAHNTTNNDPAISIWAPSESHFNQDLEAAREDMIAQLITRVEQLETRLDRNGDGSLDAGIEKAVTGGEGEEWSWSGWTLTLILSTVLWVSLLIWFCALITLWVVAYYRRAGVPGTVIYGSAGNLGNAGSPGSPGSKF